MSPLRSWSSSPRSAPWAQSLRRQDVTVPAKEGREKAVRIVRWGAARESLYRARVRAVVEAGRGIAGGEGGGPAEELTAAWAKIFTSSRVIGASPVDAAAVVTAHSGCFFAREGRMC